MDLHICRRSYCYDDCFHWLFMFPDLVAFIPLLFYYMHILQIIDGDYVPSLCYTLISFEFPFSVLALVSLHVKGLKLFMFHPLFILLSILYRYPQAKGMQQGCFWGLECSVFPIFFFIAFALD